MQTGRGARDCGPLHDVLQRISAGERLRERVGMENMDIRKLMAEEERSKAVIEFVAHTKRLVADVNPSLRPL
jgi:hypothetical protein